ncbi:MAG TPA: TraM recognition domain-containing protein [Candidatus Paceibacterota bacterium]|nr:TraM recognition domain-containing protein [Candidatus Paceibacterota bacterium]
MEHYTLSSEYKKFSSPEEELDFLRQKIKEKEAQLRETHERPNQDTIIREEIKKYAATPSETVLEKGYAHLDTQTKEIVLELSPETHDKKIEELFGVVYSKGIRNALAMIAHFNNPHLEDDFHRFLVQYIKSGLPAQMSETDPIMKSLRHTLYEVNFKADAKEAAEKRPLKELISSMEQLYTGLLNFEHRTDNSFSIEDANPEGTLETSFFVSVPDVKRDLFEKQLLAVFPKAKLIEKKDDYNVFNYEGETAAAYAHLHSNPIFPIKTYDKFDYDSLNILLNSFSKIAEEGEGVAIQLVVEPDKGDYLWRYKDALRQLEQGADLKRATEVKHGFLGALFKTTKNLAADAFSDALAPKSGSKPMDPAANIAKKKEHNAWAIEEIKNKISTPIAHVSLKIVASAGTMERAEHILNDVTTVFNQFENTQGNKFSWKRVPEKKIIDFVREYAYRRMVKDEAMPLSIRELTSILHFPTGEISSPHVKISKAATAPAPVGLPQQGTLLGVNFDRNQHTNIYMQAEDRMRHMYVIGQTGTGKTTLLKNMIIQDIKNGEGVCFIDPHGSDVQDILAAVPKERYDDVIYFDPGYTARPMGLNMLEYDPNFPEQKTFVVNEMLSIFNKLFDMKVAGGPMFEQYFRNSVMLVMDDPETGNTLLDVAKVLSSKQFRDFKISRCKNPLVVQFWKEIAEKAGGESSLANMVPYITNKFDVFLSNDIMRPIVSQEKSSFKMREIMDTKKIFLVNLAKGRLGDINANLLGLILVGKILMAALSRVDSFGKDMAPFYLYIDEFQNITTDSISQILSEARKYKLSLTIAHQFIAQLEDDIKDAVFGNVGSISAFRVGADDAEYLEKQFEPIFEANDILNLDNRNCYMKLLVSGKPVRPFSMETLPPQKGNPAIVPKLQELSYLMYGKDRSLIEEEIMRKYRKDPPPAMPSPIERPIV